MHLTKKTPSKLASHIEWLPIQYSHIQAPRFSMAYVCIISTKVVAMISEKIFPMGNDYLVLHRYLSMVYICTVSPHFYAYDRTLK